MWGRGELYLVLGFAVLSLAMAIFPFSMVGLLALPLLPIALSLLAIGVMRVKGTRNQGVSLQRQAVGLVLLVLGLAALFVVALGTSELALQIATHWERPSQPTPAMGDWLFVAMGWVLPAVLIGFGFGCWTGWSFRHCRNWAIAVLFVCPAILFLFCVLHGIGGRVTN